MNTRYPVTWITGASSGIGEALAKQLASQGATLILSARDEAQLERVRSECENSKDHLVLPVDLTDPSWVERAALRALAHRGHIDLLVNNAGMSNRGYALQTKLEVDRKVMELNYFGTIAVTKAILPSMLERKQGRIVVVSSVLGKLGFPGRTAYAASKHALHGFFDGLRAEVAPQGVGVTIVCPGYVKTEMSLHAVRGDGKLHAVMDEEQATGMPVETCARKILDAVYSGKDEAVIARKEWLGVILKRLSPALLNWALKKRG